MLKAEAVRAWVTTFLVDLLNIEPSAIKGDTHLHSLGLDSVDAVVMAGAMEEHFKVEINAALFLRNPTLDSLVADLKANGIAE